MEAESFLSQNLLRMREMEKFAEAKNTTMFVSAIGALLLCFQVSIKPETPELIKAVVMVSALFFFISVILALFSFFPLARYRGLRDENTDNINTLYYGDLTKISVIQYKAACFDPEHQKLKPEVLDDYSEQILIHARITSVKMTLYKFSVYAFLFGILTPILGLIISGGLAIRSHRFRKTGSAQ